MTKATLTPVAAAILTRGADGVFESSAMGTVVSAVSSAASMQTKANDKWLSAGTAAFKAGITVAMITESTEKNPNPQFNEKVYQQLWDAVVIGVSAGKGEVKFTEPNPFSTGADQLKKKDFHRWTVSQVLALDKAALRLVTDPVFRTQRKVFQQNVGSMVNRLRTYIDRLEDPDKARAARTEKVAKVAKDAPMLDRMAAMLVEFNANVLALKDEKGKALSGVIQAQEAALHLAALVGAMRKASTE
jgi:hypothetical protein